MRQLRSNSRHFGRWIRLDLFASSGHQLQNGESAIIWSAH
jgi:hypothetical protein